MPGSTAALERRRPARRRFAWRLRVNLALAAALFFPAPPVIVDDDNPEQHPECVRSLIGEGCAGEGGAERLHGFFPLCFKARTIRSFHAATEKQAGHRTHPQGRNVREGAASRRRGAKADHACVWNLSRLPKPWSERSGGSGRHRGRKRTPRLPCRQPRQSPARLDPVTLPGHTRPPWQRRGTALPRIRRTGPRYGPGSMTVSGRRARRCIPCRAACPECPPLFAAFSKAL